VDENFKRQELDKTDEINRQFSRMMSKCPHFMGATLILTRNFAVKNKQIEVIKLTSRWLSRMVETHKAITRNATPGIELPRNLDKKLWETPVMSDFIAKVSNLETASNKGNRADVIAAEMAMMPMVKVLQDQSKISQEDYKQAEDANARPNLAKPNELFFVKDIKDKQDIARLVERINNNRDSRKLRDIYITGVKVVSGEIKSDLDKQSIINGLDVALPLLLARGIKVVKSSEITPYNPKVVKRKKTRGMER